MSDWNEMGATQIVAIFVSTAIIILGFFFSSWFLPLGHIIYSSGFETPASTTDLVNVFEVTHVGTPAVVKGIYLSSWAAGNSRFRKELNDIVDTTEVNSVVIDIKDYTGHISFLVDDPSLKQFGADENRIPDIKRFIADLHSKGVYVIGRISSFQDSYLINGHPEWAVKTKEGNVWKDFKGVKWLDAGATPVWDYLVAIGNQAYADGFDELNFDYIRFPSDGNMQDVSYDWQNGRTREQVMSQFFQYLHDKFASTSITISADIFGLTTSAEGDLGIGQVLTDALKNFDYVSPMVYPSHFANGFNGYTKPAEHPYDVIRYSMDHAVIKANQASTSPEKLRPWLQAFDLGAIYTPDMVRKQIQATYDSGLTSWLLWNAGGIYNKEALLPKNNTNN